MTRKACVALLSFFVLAALCATAQEPTKAAAQHTTDTPRFHGGDEVNFKLTLNEPLPKGAHIDVRFSPSGIAQQFSSSCDEPNDKDRKELLCKFKLADNARGGQWQIAVVYFFLQNVSWTSSTIATDLKFQVDGPDGPLPTTATAKIINK